MPDLPAEEFDELVEIFRELLSVATANVPEEYFLMPVQGASEPVFRERVYCYELYHQLRCIWPADFAFSLGGEVDKSAHPVLGSGPLNRLKPDFLVHLPGDMTGNLIVIEVKPVNAPRRAIMRDLSSLRQFLQYAGYQHAIYLVYGGSEAEFGQFCGRLDEVCKNDNPLDHNLTARIELWWHESPGIPARIVNWL